MGANIKSTAPTAEIHIPIILDSLRRIVRVLRVGSRAAEKSVGLSGAQLFVLRALKNAPAQSLNELAERTSTHQSSVSVVVQRLVDRKLVIRTSYAGDTRRVELALSAKGQSLLRHAPDAVQGRLISGIEAMSAADQAGLANLLAQLVARMGEGDAGVEMFFEEPSADKTKKGRAK
jgi:DNA-binding MarR family transcriptional regulator